MVYIKFSNRIMLEIHNVYFMKKDFSQSQAEAWIKAHGYKLKKKDLKQHTPTEWRSTKCLNKNSNHSSHCLSNIISPNGVHFLQLVEGVKGIKFYILMIVDPSDIFFLN